ncbi:MAG: hypothetical protein RLO12_03705 [Fulvivirga sp.]
MKIFRFTLLLSLFACSEEDISLNYGTVNISIIDQKDEYLAGQEIHVMATIKTPNTLREIKVFFDENEYEIVNFQNDKEHVIDTTVRLHPVRTLSNLRIEAKDERGNFKDEVGFNLKSYALPEVCKQNKNITLILLAPITTPDNESIFLNGSFNNNTFGDDNFMFSRIPKTINCFCINEDNLPAVQFNRGSPASINQSQNCTDAFYGFSNTPATLGIELDKWKDLDCN